MRKQNIKEEPSLWEINSKASDILKTAMLKFDHTQNIDIEGQRLFNNRRIFDKIIIGFFTILYFLSVAILGGLAGLAITLVIYGILMLLFINMTTEYWLIVAGFFVIMFLLWIVGSYIFKTSAKVRKLIGEQ